MDRNGKVTNFQSVPIRVDGARIPTPHTRNRIHETSRSSQILNIIFSTLSWPLRDVISLALPYKLPRYLKCDDFLKQNITARGGTWPPTNSELVAKHLNAFSRFIKSIDFNELQ